MAPANDRDRAAHQMLLDALALERGERRAFVEERCESDTALRGYVFALLDAADRAGTFLEAPAVPRAASEAPRIPDSVGSYLILDVLGVGGMATVYEAEQQQPKRRVALKVLHQGMSSPEAYVRFQFEAETLARLHHPEIAQVYEAGAAEVGGSARSLFFAMELIPDARPLTRYADERGLSLHERTVMFERVCEAVHFGHQNGVIHRDLKPGNILVGHDGRAKIIDFGVAKTTSPERASPTALVGAAQVIGTLNYMSPEQCGASNDVDIRTDVYSLGVVLYELTTGQLPHDLSSSPLPAALQTIMNDPAPPPALPKAHSALAAIILKALEKDPDRRYDSASALAADLRRFLRHEPVSARPPGLIESGLLFGRRHKALASAVLVVATSVLLLAAVSTVFAVRLSREVEARRQTEWQIIGERDRARWEAYIARVAGALSALETGEFERMRHQLALADYAYKGWEWGFLSRQSDRSVSSFEAHAGMILSGALAPDDERFVTAASDGTVRLWGAGEQRRLASFESESGARVMAAAFTLDGERVITGDDEGVVRLLDGGDLHVISVLRDNGAGVRSVAGLGDGRVVIADSRGNAFVGGLEGLEALPTDQGGGIHVVAVSDDGALLATSNDDGRVWIRSASTFEPIAKLEIPGSVNQVRFGGGSRVVAAAGGSGDVLVWSLPDGEPLATIRATTGATTVRSLAFSNDMTMLAVGLTHRGIVVFTIPDGVRLGEFGGHTDAVSSLHFVDDDRTLVSTSWDRTVRTWSVGELASPTGTTVLRGARDYVFDARFSPGGDALASVSRDGTVRFWDPDLAEQIATVRPGESSLYALAYSPDGTRLVVGGSDGFVGILDTCTGEVTGLTANARTRVMSLDWDDAGTRIVAGCEDGSVQTWNARTGTALLGLSAHSARVNSVCFSPDGSMIASASRDGTASLWDAETGARLPCDAHHNSDVFAVLFSADGGLLFTGSRDQTIGIWDVANGSRVRSLGGHGQFITCLSLSPDGPRLAAGSWFGEIVLFDVRTGDLIASFRAHDSAVRAIDFSPNGRWLATGSFDSTIRLFDSATRGEAETGATRARDAMARTRSELGDSLGSAATGEEARRQRLLRLAEARRDDPWVRKAILGSLFPPSPPGTAPTSSPQAGSP